MTNENPEVLFGRALVGDKEACDALMTEHPGYVFGKYKTGDKDIVDLLMRHFGPAAKKSVQGKISTNLQSRIDASGVLQEVSYSLLKPSQAQWDVESYSQLRGWFVSIVNHRTTDAVRKEIAQKNNPAKEIDPGWYQDGCSVEEFVIPDDGSTVSTKMSREETIKKVRDEIERLPEEFKGIARMRFLEQRTQTEIANTVGSLSVVQRALRKSKEILRSRLRSDFGLE